VLWDARWRITQLFGSDVRFVRTSSARFSRTLHAHQA